MQDSELLKKYEPVLRFAKSERFFPMAVEPYLDRHIHENTPIFMIVKKNIMFIVKLLTWLTGFADLRLPTEIFFDPPGFASYASCKALGRLS